MRTRPGSRKWLAAIAIGIGSVAAYAPAMRAPFFFDDIPAIVNNTSIRSAWPPMMAFRPPADTPVAGRPITNYSFALNRALNKRLGIEQQRVGESEAATATYHVANLALHLACGLLLFGVIRRTADSAPRVREWVAEGRLSPSGIAGAVCAIWLLHPLQTEAVIYLTQRTELLASFFYVGTLYASIRAWDARGEGARRGWSVAAVALCLLGMGSKEIMVSAPFMILLYDRAFRYGSWREARRRLPLYTALALTTTWLVWILSARPRAATVGFGLGVTWYEYLYTQAWAIGHYVRLMLWPDGQSIDYGASLVRGAAGVPGLLGLAALFAATIAAWTRPDRWGWFGFLGAWIFLILGPSSSVVPIVTEVAAERRFYLPLAAALVLLVATAEAARRRVGSPDLRDRLVRLRLPAVTGLCLLLGATTFVRSRVYVDTEELWRDAIRKVPTNPRAWEYVAALIFERDEKRIAEADSLLNKAIQLDSNYHTGYGNLAVLAVAERRFEDARSLLERAIAIKPDDKRWPAALGSVLLELGDPEGAIRHLERTPENPAFTQATVDLAKAYLETGRPRDAVRALEVAAELDPERTDVLRFLGTLLLEEGAPAAAIPHLERAVAVEPMSGLSLGLLSLAYAATGRRDDAARTAARAAALSGGEAKALLFAGRAMLLAGRPADAEIYLNDALGQSPDDHETITALGLVKLFVRDNRSAAMLFRRALELEPGFQPAMDGLATAEGR